MQIKEEKNGEVMIVTIDDHLDTASAPVFETRLLGLIDDPTLRREMAESARAYASGQTWGAIMGRLRDRYLALAGRRASMAV